MLAADLALCHPRVGAREVRAVARELPTVDMFRLTVAARDRRGFLAATTAVLAAAGMSVETASVTTWPDHQLALHALTVRCDGGMDSGDVGRDRHPPARQRGHAATVDVRAVRPRPCHPHRRRARHVDRAGHGADDVGLLAAICRWFADQGVSIEAAGIDTVDGVASDVFLVDGECDTGALALHLSASPPAPPCARLVRNLLAAMAR